jgi:adenylate cyclase class 2
MSSAGKTEKHSLPTSSPLDSAPREIEIKLPVPDASAAREILQRAGFTESDPRAFEADEVYDTPNLDMRRAACLLRLREFKGRAILTYKGPPEPSAHRKRMELETEVSNAAALRMIFSQLGYEAMFRYEKFRTAFTRADEQGHALLDETPIGHYIELEGPPHWIDAVASALGFTPAAYIRDSYGALYQKWCEQNGITPTHMVFPHAAR